VVFEVYSVVCGRKVV